MTDEIQPNFEELKEIPKLRELAKMVTDHPCFTNAILAVTEAYRTGLSSRGDAPTPPAMTLYCFDCRATGLLHCSDPEHCGSMRSYPIEYIRERRAESALAHPKETRGDAGTPLVEAAKQLVFATSHAMGCQFRGCTCGAVEDLKVARAEVLRQIAESALAHREQSASVNTTTRTPRDSEEQSEAGQVKLSGVQDHADTVQVVGGRPVADREAKQEPAFGLLNSLCCAVEEACRNDVFSARMQIVCGESRKYIDRVLSAAPQPIQEAQK